MSLPPPRELTELVADLTRDTDVTPDVEEIPGFERRWQLTLRNDRVLMTMVVKSAGRGRYAWVRSALTVDGQPRPVAESYSHFVRIFNDPDETPPERAVPEPLPPCSPEGLPPMVASAYGQLAKSLGAEAVVLGHEHNHWALDIVSPNGQAFLRLSYRRPKRGKPVSDMRLTMIVEGRDRSREVRGDLDVALALLARQSTPNTGPATADSGQEATSGQGYGSVGVRRHSVIRN